MKVKSEWIAGVGMVLGLILFGVRIGNSFILSCIMGLFFGCVAYGIVRMINSPNW